MFSEDDVGLIEEMGFQPSSELSLTDGCWVEIDRKGIPDDWCCNVEAPPMEPSSGPWHNHVSTLSQMDTIQYKSNQNWFYWCEIKNFQFSPTHARNQKDNVEKLK